MKGYESCYTLTFLFLHSMQPFLDLKWLFLWIIFDRGWSSILLKNTMTEAL